MGKLPCRAIDHRGAISKCSSKRRKRATRAPNALSVASAKKQRHFRSLSVRAPCSRDLPGVETFEPPMTSWYAFLGSGGGPRARSRLRPANGAPPCAGLRARGSQPRSRRRGRRRPRQDSVRVFGRADASPSTDEKPVLRALTRRCDSLVAAQVAMTRGRTSPRLDDVLTPIRAKSPQPSTGEARRFYADAEGNDVPAALPRALPRPEASQPSSQPGGRL